MLATKQVPRKRTKTCTAHCRSCGGHFAGTTAFDAHRRGAAANRTCVDPSANPRFESKVGSCRIAGARPGPTSSVWGLCTSGQGLPT